MKYKSLVQSILTAALLLFSTLVFAGNVKDPEKCPDVSVLQKYPFIFATKISGDNTWLAFQTLSKYDTNEIWEFAVAVHAQGRLEALKAAYSTISTLNNAPGPVNIYGVWFCNYTSPDGEDVGQARVLNF